MGKKIICVTGTHGFVGSNLINGLNKITNIQVIAFQGDITKEEEVGLFFSKNPAIDQVIHLAGVFSNNFDQLIKVNLIGTKNLLDASIKNRIKKFIFASSGAVYGQLAQTPSEESNILHPSILYGLSKQFSEQCIQYYWRNFGLKYIILRFSNIYGSNNTKGVIHNFLEDIKKNKSIKICGDGEQKRDFIYIDDAIDAIIKTIQSSENNEIFNVSGDKIYSLNDISKILKNNKLVFEINYKPQDINNLLIYLAGNNNKIKKKLKWQPKVSLENGLKEIINYCK